MAPGRPIAWLGPGILLLAAIVPDLRPLAAVLVPAGWIGLRARGHPDAIGWAAAAPLAISLAWPWVLGGDVSLGAAGCAAPLSIIAMRRVVLAAVALAVVAVLVRYSQSNPADLGLRRPRRTELAVAIGAALAIAVGGLVIGPAIARPFFGELAFTMPVAAIVPALAFGVANGFLEELVYRGVLQTWLGRLVPVGAAIAFQGVVFGILHAGPEVQALLPVHIALLSAAGIAAGIVRWRTGSLWIPIGVHVGADVALYFGLACRPAAV